MNDSTFLSASFSSSGEYFSFVMARHVHGYGFEGNVGYGTREHI